MLSLEIKKRVAQENNFRVSNGGDVGWCVNAWIDMSVRKTPGDISRSLFFIPIFVHSYEQQFRFYSSFNSFPALNSPKTEQKTLFK